MRLRTAKFVMIPMWVMSHPQVRGNATRIASYAGLRAVAWEAPDTDWRSLREIARAISDVNGLTEETVRKHLAALQEIGAMRRQGDELVIPDDEPGLGTDVGTQPPNSGSDGTQTEELTLFSKREGENTPVGTTGGGSADLNKEHPDFPTFWHAYPRRKDRTEAVKAFNKARQAVPVAVIMEALDREKRGWQTSRRPISKIPYPATWLNRWGWMNDADEPDPGKASTSEQRSAEAAAAQRNEIRRAIDAGQNVVAWKMLVEKAGSRPETSWWPEAERLRDRSNGAIAAAVGVDEELVAGWREIRKVATTGRWAALSQHVRELAP